MKSAEIKDMSVQDLQERIDAEKAKLATLTMVATGVDTDIKEFVADKLGCALTNLNKLEATLPAVVQEIAAEKKAVMDAMSKGANSADEVRKALVDELAKIGLAGNANLIKMISDEIEKVMGNLKGK